jgi:hypothetical protein
LGEPVLGRIELALRELEQLRLLLEHVSDLNQALLMSSDLDLESRQL